MFVGLDRVDLTYVDEYATSIETKASPLVIWDRLRDITGRDGLNSIADGLLNSFRRLFVMSWCRVRLMS